MVRLFFILVVFSVSKVALASDVVVCGPDPLRQVQGYQVSVNTQDEWLSDPTLILNPDLRAVKGVAVRYWKCVAGNLEPMTAEEQQVIDTLTPQEIRLKEQQDRIRVLGDSLESDVLAWDTMTPEQKDVVMKKLLEREVIQVELFKP